MRKTKEFLGRVPKWQWAVLMVAVAFFLGSFLTNLYTPWFDAQVWYLRHMNGVTFMGKVIPVPRGMVGSAGKKFGEEEANFFQYPPSTQEAVRNREVWDMSFYPAGSPNETPEDTIKRVETNMRAFAARTGESFGPGFEVATQGGKGRCYTTTIIAGKVIDTTCLLFNARWEVIYEGPPSRQAEFFKVIAGIRDIKK